MKENWSNKFLEQEILIATIALRRVEDSRRFAPGGTSEAGLNFLDEKVFSAQKKLEGLLAKRNARLVQSPAVRQRQSEVKSVSSGKRSSKNDFPEDVEKEQVPIIVFDNGLPRSWRPGDAIYKKR
jgi:hypothetical protein